MLVVTTQDADFVSDSISNTQASYIIPTLPLSIELENKLVLKKCQEAARALAELKGFAYSMPNKGILINTLSLQEAKDSAAIENIITTHDEVFQSDVETEFFLSLAAKEVHAYAAALRMGYKEVKKTGLLTNNLIKQMQSKLVNNSAGFRVQSGTVIKNQQTREHVYLPPQHPAEIITYMDKLEKFINDASCSDWDPLIKMAVIHHQFESIHPFYDGNGRVGRIINVLYLVQQGLLDAPILYLSRYINQNRAQYYSLLRAVQTQNRWQDWVLFMLEGVLQIATQTTDLIRKIKQLMQSYKDIIRNQSPKIYSQDLLNNLFDHPYTKLSFIERDLSVSRPTARRYLDTLLGLKIVSKHKIGRDMYYCNDELFSLFLPSKIP